MKNTIEFRWINDESCDVYMNGVFITNLNHDDHGWAGMETAIYGLKRAALIGDIEIVVKGEEGL